MRALHVRLCCACRALVPRDLMWRVMQLRPPRPPGSAPPLKALPRRRKIRRRWVYLRKRAAQAAAALPAAAATEDAAASAEQQAVEAPTRKRQAFKRGSEQDADRPPPRSGSRVLLQRLAGGASEALQADEALWAPPSRSVRSVYVCRTPACVQAAVKRKARPARMP
jgi:predicted RNA-binding protein YlxR (DUF448 family)